MPGKWLISAIAACGILFAAGTGMAQTDPADVPDAGTATTCGNIDECMEEGAFTADRSLSGTAYMQACVFGSGQGCYNVAALADNGIGPGLSQAAIEQYLQVGCQLDHASSCREASLAARAAGRKAEAWAFLALEARLTGQRIWEMDNAEDVALTLPDGTSVLPPFSGLAFAPGNVSTALTCAGYWQAISPDSPEAAGWQAAARAAFIAWPPLEGEPARTAEEADRWIGDQAVIWHGGNGSALDPNYLLTTSRCFMGRGRL